MTPTRTSLQVEHREPHAERKQQQRDRHVAHQLDREVERRPEFEAGKIDRQRDQRGEYHRHAPEIPEPRMMVEHPGAERVVQHVLDEEQHHGCRQRRFAEGEHHQRQAHVARVGEHHRRHEGLRLLAQRTCDSPRNQTRTEHQRQRAKRQPIVGRQVEALRGQRGENQRRDEHLHVQLVGEGHVDTAARIAITCIQPPRRDDGEDREDDGEDAQQHESARGFRRPNYPSNYL